MKKFSILIFALFMWVGQAQNIADYEYVYVPKKFSDFDQNQYQLNTFLNWKLKKMGYKTVWKDPLEWPVELRQNPCKVLIADAENVGNLFTNKIKVNFTDCNKNLVAEYKASSSIKDFSEGLRDAMDKALASMPKSAPNPAQNYSNVAEETVIVTKKVEKSPYNDLLPEEKQAKGESSVTQIRVNASENPVFTDGKAELNKIGIGGKSFILIQKGKTDAFAVFRPSAKEGVYRVQLQNGVNTLGYVADDKITIEIPVNGDFENKVFELKK
ncbi:hypothetical protein EDL98_06870 [Ornithobacterium rhinotracheale]|uniref:hypothetical protein n=1 Tax=Ornithobacterium rhinotracheale TaxID=28251 RepID=UPI00129C4355|nr:hypothetical protein [Ornithobacterium rhinotracheale]MRJ10804.1 hypothetical protein [Ornithobacterium rhinotracheale]